jgi:hypothetical protein
VRSLLPALLVLTGCQQPPLSQALDTNSNPLLAELPAEAPLLIGGEPEAVVELLTSLDMMPIQPDLIAAERLVGACTADGCVMILEGELERARELTALSRRRTRELPDGVELIADDGLALQARWSPGRLRLGHAEAVEGLEHAHPLDPATIAGDIPEGDLWIYARDQELLAAQITDWLTRRGPAGAEALATLNTTLAQRPALARQIQSVALSFTAAQPAEVRLRLRCSSAGSARQVSLAMQALRTLNAQGTEDPRIANALSAVSFARQDALVEATFIDSDGLALSLAREQTR